MAAKRRWNPNGPCWKSNLGEEIDVERKPDGSSSYTGTAYGGDKLGPFSSLTEATLAVEAKNPMGRRC